MDIRKVHEQFNILTICTMEIYVLLKEDENCYLRPQLSLLMLRLYHLRRNFDVSIKFISQHVKDDNICENVYDH